MEIDRSPNSHGVDVLSNSCFVPVWIGACFFLSRLHRPCTMYQCLTKEQEKEKKMKQKARRFSDVSRVRLNRRIVSEKLRRWQWVLAQASSKRILDIYVGNKDLLKESVARSRGCAERTTGRS